MNTDLNRSSADRMPPAMPPCEAAVEWIDIDCGGLPASAGVTRFRNTGNITEYHVTVRLDGGAGGSRQFQDLENAYLKALETAGIRADTAVLRRMFCSDVVNQSVFCESLAPGSPWPVSQVEQAPLPASRFSLWAWHVCGTDTRLETSPDGTTLSLRRGPLTHHWSVGMADPSEKDSHEQTRRIMARHDDWMRSKGMNMTDHLVRTWWFLANIDADYQGLVDARSRFFASRGLTRETHYIASTGIAGAHPEVSAKVALDAYAIGGLVPGQVEFITAPDHLCPTHEYGVTFERAASVSYADRKHIFISGTASIDTSGRILHPGDVIGQFDRTIRNVEALLRQADANLGDLASIIVYLRDPADGVEVEAVLRDRFGNIPFVLVHAPVCRPGWLVEIEGIAIVPANRPELPEF